MLKKAGIVFAAAAASLVAVSPLAFASEGHGHGDTNIAHSDFASKDGKGLVNVSGNNANVPVQVCNNNVPVNVLGVQVPVEDLTAGLSGALGLLGNAENKGSTATDNSDNCAQNTGAGDTLSQ
ncbi:hypothetical protein [Pseudonocardia sp. T1-2H]|uniref:hypothetical protein n=1 Tax=Pseudonocardia sp. T1-2H TaxID=3128899 RepID=UPI0031016C39